MACLALDFSELLQGIPAGAWVAISERQHAVVSYGSDMRDVLAEAKEKGEAEPVILRVPEQNLALFL